MRWLLNLALFLGQSLAQEPQHASRVIPPHLADTASPRFFLPRNDMRGVATMTTEVMFKSQNRMDLTLAWKDAPHRELHTSDWIGAFDHDLLTEFGAPVLFRYVFPVGTKWDNLTNYGSMNFSVFNLRSSYVFIYISGNRQYPEYIAHSPVVRFDSVSHPMSPHLAFSPTDPTKMMVMWNQLSPKRPTLKWGLRADKLENSVNASSDTYVKDDFCDRDFSPAARQGWFEPGLFLTAEMPIVPNTTYYYVVGDEDDGFWDAALSFTTPSDAASAPTKLIVFADMGNAPEDGALQHSFDFHNQGELPSRNTTRLAKRLFENNDAHAVVHVGDIAYSVGYLSEWDQFMNMIEPVASRIPWMASIGNHEMGWSKSDEVFNGSLRTGQDSGGECGVAFLKRFPFAKQPLAKGVATRDASPWYSFHVGLVHFAMISSEHDFSIGSPQWKWLKSDLQSVDRSQTPWVAVTSHRAMYIQSNYDGDINIANLLQENLEPLLLKHDVDFFFAGHHHSYQRFCKVNNGTCVDKDATNGVYHFVVGMAGYDHSPVAKRPPPGTPRTMFADDKHWGVTYWEFTRTVATMKFMDGATDEVVDQYTFQKSAVAEKALVI